MCVKNAIITKDIIEERYLTAEGTIYEVIFRNDENGYTIATVECEGHPVTAVGIFPPVSEGHYVKMTGQFVNHPRFGRQFKAESVRLAKPDTKNGMIMFLGSGLIKGIGPRRAEAIVNKFGESTFDIIEMNPSRLGKVSGISAAMAKQIAKSYGEVKMAADVLTFLMDYGISANMSMKIFIVYKENTIAAVSSNPYALIEDINGIGFLTADRIAEKLGIDKNSDFRVRAGIMHALSEAADKSGNTFLPVSEATEFAQSVLGLENTGLIQDNIERLILSHKLKQTACDSETGIMLSSFYSAESKSADKLVRMMEYTNRAGRDHSSDIKRFEDMHGISFHESQKEAISAALSSGVSVITGGPGTGKTTIVKCIISILTEVGESVKIMAPTGRAAKRLSETTGQNASTIHRALMSDEQLFADVVIVDEFSMVDVLLLSRMLEQMSDETKLVIVGDSDQLPSVGAGNVLSDIINSGVVPTRRLTHIFRQEDCSNIVINAHKINNGQCPDLKNAGKDFFFIKSASQEETAKTAVELVKSRLPSYLGVEPKNIQVLCPMKAGKAGSINLNKQLRDALIPKTEEIIVGDNAFSVGDKVMHTINNYNLAWRKGIESGEGIFNGDIGYVCSIRPGSGEMDVEFEDGRLVTYGGEDKTQLILAYAITVHKSQGSEYDGVVLSLSGGHYMIMTRNLLYTAITRAKNLVVIVGDEETVNKMVRNNFIQKRYSMLRELLILAREKRNLLFTDTNGN